MTGSTSRDNAIVRTEKRPVVGADAADQFLARFGLHGFTQIDLSKACERLFRYRTGEHEQWPGEIRTVDFTELQKPHYEGPYPPSHGSPPAILTRPEI